MYDIITLGSATIDVFAETDKKYVHGKNYCFPVGSKLLVEHLETHTGGGGTNTAVSFSKLGLKVAYIGKIGVEANAVRIVHTLKQEGVDTSLICHKQGKTGYSFIIDAVNYDRTIFAYKGTNDQLSPEWIDGIKPKLKTKWFYFSAMMGQSFKSAEKLALFAKQNNIKIAFNPSGYLAKKGPRFLKTILCNTTVLVFNKEEAQLLTGKKSLNEMFKSCYNYGPKYVVITDGSKGSYASDGNTIYHVQPHKVKIVETTGAGDSFASTFVACLYKGKDMMFALKAATLNAESVIQHYGAKHKLLNWNELVHNVNSIKTVVKVIT
jgi:ribokinase